MRIPFFGRKPEPFTEGQIEYLRRYPVLGDMIGRGRPLPSVPGLVPPPVPPRHGEHSQQWEDYGVAFWQLKPLAPLPMYPIQRQTR